MYLDMISAHPQQETMNGEIHLHEDDPVALEVVLNHLHIQSMACGPMESSSIHASWHSLAFRNEPCPLARYAITDAQEYLETIVGLYLIADKYDMPVVRTMCAECSLSNSIDGLLLAFGDGNNEQPDSTLKEGDVLVFKQKFFDVICDRLGDYPEDLFGLFYDFVEQSLEEGCDTKVMFEACAQYPRLSVYVSTTLANTLRTANRQSLENANRAAGYRQELGRVKRLVANVSEVLVTYN